MNKVITSVLALSFAIFVPVVMTYGQTTTIHACMKRDGEPNVWRLAFATPGATTIKLYLQCARTT